MEEIKTAFMIMWCAFAVMAIGYSIIIWFGCQYVYNCCFHFNPERSKHARD